MIATASHNALEERIATLERRLADAIAAVDEQVGGFDARLRRMELGASETPRPSVPAVSPLRPAAAADRRSTAEAAPRDRTAPSAAGASSALRSGMSFGDLVGGRVLAWLGGVAILLGIVLFLALAVSHGWIGVQARILLAAAASAALMAAGAWLHAHRGRTEAAIVMVGSATAGSFATLIAASDVYELLPGSLAVVGAMLVGVLATTLAVRWAGRAIGGVGLLGALLSGVLVGASADPATAAMLAVAAACAMWVVVWQRWGWLALGTVIVCAPQWAMWVLQGQPVLLDVVVLAGFAALGLLGAVGVQLRAGEDRLAPASAAVAVLSACIVAVVGRVALADAAGASAGDLWLAALACVHVGVGAWRVRRARISPPLRQLLIAVGVTLADVAFGLSAHGVVLAIGWGGSAVAFAWLARRSASEENGETVFGVGVGVHIALALVRVLIDAPPSDLAGGHAQLLGLLSVSSLAASCIACARLSAGERTVWRVALDSVGLIAIAYLTASALSGAALAVAWAFEGLALAQLSSRGDDALSRIGALAFVGAAALHAVAVDAPPDALRTGDADLGAAALALGALAAVGLRVGSTRPVGSARRQWSLVGAAGCVLYLASLATVAAFQPTTAAASATVFELTVNQQSQVALSALWSLAGVAALIVGLRTNVAPARTAGLTLLLVTVGKVFLYDLATLTSLYRVVSFTVLGLLLLAGAFAYQRLRPPPLPDMRTVHPSQR